MGNIWVRELREGSAFTPKQDSEPTFDPLLGFPNGRKQRVMTVSAEVPTVQCLSNSYPLTEFFHRQFLGICKIERAHHYLLLEHLCCLYFPSFCLHFNLFFFSFPSLPFLLFSLTFSSFFPPHFPFFFSFLFLLSRIAMANTPPPGLKVYRYFPLVS